jgi:ABC-type antimicrobial peptide transport system permease subunit
MALGAGRGDVVRLVLGRALGLACVGAAIGVVGAVAATRVLRTLLFGVSPTDALTLAAVPLLLLAVAAAAAYGPARRAALTDPVAALRME